MSEQMYSEDEVLQVAQAALEMIGVGAPMPRPVAEFFAALLRKTDYRRVRVASVVGSERAGAGAEQWAVIFYCPEHKCEHVAYNDRHGAAILEALARQYDARHPSSAQTYAEVVRWLGVTPPPEMPLE